MDCLLATGFFIGSELYKELLQQLAGHAAQYDAVLLLQIIDGRDAVEKVSSQTVELPHQQGRLQLGFSELENATEAVTLGGLIGDN
jgi:hypothetical protein